MARAGTTIIATIMVAEMVIVIIMMMIMAAVGVVAAATAEEDRINTATARRLPIRLMARRALSTYALTVVPTAIRLNSMTQTLDQGAIRSSKGTLAAL